MKLDGYRTIVMEQCWWPGSIGDSCAETGREDHLRFWLDLPSNCDLNQFVTELGFIRHPTAPAKDDHGESWREPDFTSDQGLPLYFAAKARGLPIAQLMHDRIKAAGWKTGNGDYTSPGLFAAITDKKCLLNATVWGQAMIFKFPFRWNDEKKGFEPMETSYADYLNWIHAALYCPQHIRSQIPKSLLKSKVRSYYLKEPNSQWIIDLYDQVLDRYFS